MSCGSVINLTIPLAQTYFSKAYIRMPHPPVIHCPSEAKYKGVVYNHDPRGEQMFSGQHNVKNTRCMIWQLSVYGFISPDNPLPSAIILEFPGFNFTSSLSDFYLDIVYETWLAPARWPPCRLKLICSLLRVGEWEYISSPSGIITCILLW